MKTQQPSQKRRLGQKLQTQLGKEYSFSAKPDLRENRFSRGLQMQALL